MPYKVVVGRNVHTINKTVIYRDRKYNYLRGSGTTRLAEAEAEANRQRRKGYLTTIRSDAFAVGGRSALAYFVYRRKK